MSKLFKWSGIDWLIAFIGTILIIMVVAISWGADKSKEAKLINDCVNEFFQKHKYNRVHDGYDWWEFWQELSSIKIEKFDYNGMDLGLYDVRIVFTFKKRNTQTNETSICEMSQGILFKVAKKTDTRFLLNYCPDTTTANQELSIIDFDASSPECMKDPEKGKAL